MRASQTCPKCAGKKFAVVAEFRTPDSQSSNMTEDFPAVTVRVKDGWIEDRKSFGKLETWICAGCGYTEFYAREVGGLVEAARRWPDQVRLVDGGPSAPGPYR